MFSLLFPLLLPALREEDRSDADGLGLSNLHRKNALTMQIDVCSETVRTSGERRANKSKGGES